MPGIWSQVERLWPAGGGMGQGGYRKWRSTAAELLAHCSIGIVGFSHFGVVVKSMEDALCVVTRFTNRGLGEVKTAWVEAYGVQIARFPLGRTELELIEPRRESFFAEHQRSFGDGLHHLSFQVGDIYQTLEKLSAGGVQLIDREPRSGSHGKVAFIGPRELSPVYVEVFQAIEPMRPASPLPPPPSP